MSTPGTDVATRNGQLSGLAIRPGQEIFNAKQRAGLAVLGIKDCDDAELAVFMHYCQKTQLDPFSKQIYYIGRRNKDRWQDENGRWQEQWVTKWTIQVGIDGFRVIRDRIVDRLGITVEYEDTIWYDADGGEHDVWLWDHAPAAAKVTVLRNGKRYPAVVRTASYMQTNKQGEPVSQWKTQPDHMIEKCAEAFALRRAFPHDLGGVYIPEEIPRGDEPGEVTAAVRITAEDVTNRRQRPTASRGAPTAQDGGSAASTDSGDASPSTGAERPPSRASSGQVGIIGSHFKRLGFEEHERDERLVYTGRLADWPADLDSTKDLDQEHASRAIGRLNGIKDRAELVAVCLRLQQDAAGEPGPAESGGGDE